MKKNIKRAALLCVIILVLWIIVGIYQWSNCNCGSSDTKHKFAEDKKSMIIWLSTDNKTLPNIAISRFRIEEP